MKFYGIAVNDKNTSVLIDNLPTDYLGAVQAAKAIAKKQGINYQYVKPAENGRKEGNVITKFAKQRKLYKSVKR